MNWDADEEHHHRGTPSIGVAEVSMTSSIAAELEPVLLRMRQLQMAERADRSVHTDRRHGLLPADSLDTIFTNSTFRSQAGMTVPHRVPERLFLGRRDSQGTATTESHRRVIDTPLVVFQPGATVGREIFQIAPTATNLRDISRTAENASFRMPMMSEMEQEDRAVWESLQTANPPLVPQNSATDLNPITRLRPLE